MPYIVYSARITAASPQTPAELNFLITSIVSSYLARRGLKYQTINDAIGALECAKLELYRRVVSPYEDTKIKENGDVYSPEIIP